jgi:hypothetical protein
VKSKTNEQTKQSEQKRQANEPRRTWFVQIEEAEGAEEEQDLKTNPTNKAKSKDIGIPQQRMLRVRERERERTTLNSATLKVVSSRVTLISESSPNNKKHN